MGRAYVQLSFEDRCEIARRRRRRPLDPQNRGRSGSRAIVDCSRAEAQWRHAKSATSRPMPNEQTSARRWSGSKLDRKPDLRRSRTRATRARLSPEQIAGRMQLRQRGRTRSRHETIYRFIYAEIARTKDYSWRHYPPPRQKQTRMARPRGRKSRPASFRAVLPCRTRSRSPRSQRARALGGRSRQLRKIRTARSHPPRAHLPHSPRQQAEKQDRRPHRRASLRLARDYCPTNLRRTLTFDNGTEFARHYASAQPSASKPSSAIPTRPGRKAASKTPRPIAPVSAAQNRSRHHLAASTSTDCSAPTTLPPESALTSEPQPRSSSSNCCTSNVNPPLRHQRHDAFRARPHGQRDRRDRTASRRASTAPCGSTSGCRRLKSRP